MISKVSKVFDYSAIASGIILFLLAVLTFCDVFGRRFLNSPVTGTIELVEIGMALVAFLAMPRAFYLNANVSADFINNLNLGIFKTYLVILKFVLMISIMSVMAYSTTLTSYKFLDKFELLARFPINTNTKRGNTDNVYFETASNGAVPKTNIAGSNLSLIHI